MLQSKINIGDFDTKITIEQNTPSRNATTNEEIASWSTLTTVWSKRITKGSNQGYEADQQVAVNTKQYLIRYSTTANGIDETMRVLEGSDYFYISGLQKEPREGWIMITAENRDNA